MITPISLSRIVSFKGSNENNGVNPKHLNKLANAGKDSFTKSQLKEQIYKEKLETHPNVAFLYDPNLKHEEKMAILEKHPEIKSLDDIEKEFQINKKHLAYDTFFEVEKFTDSRNRGYEYFDLSNEINKKNLDIIVANKDNLFSRYDFKRIYGVSSSDFDDCIESGRLQQLKLYSKNNGKLCPSCLVLLTGDFVKTTLANVQRVGKVSEYFKKIAQFHGKQIMVNVLELSKLGFGSPKVLHDLVKSNQLVGDSKTITTPEGTKKYITRVDLNLKKNEEILKYVRSKRCIEISDADNLFGLTKSELSNAFFDGLLECYTDAVFVGDIEKIYIDLKSKQNIDTFNKILFEKELLNGISASNLYRAQASQRIKLAWYLASNTRRIASEIAQNDPAIIKIIQKKTKMERLDCEDVETDDLTLKKSYLNYEDRINLKNFYAKVWQEAGEEEYLEAMKKSVQILENIKKTGINGIEDVTLKNLISSTTNTSKKDFMLLL